MLGGLSGGLNVPVAAVRRAKFPGSAAAFAVAAAVIDENSHSRNRAALPASNRHDVRPHVECSD